MKRTILSVMLLFCATWAVAQLQLPAFFGNHMVMQRDMPLKVWGKAIPGKRVTVQLSDSKISTYADRNGHWEVTLPARVA